MLGLSNTQIAALAGEWIASNPALAIRMVLTSKPVGNYLINTLSDEDLEWLSQDIQTRPLGLLEYAMSARGREITRQLIAGYKQTIESVKKQPAELQVRIAD